MLRLFSLILFKTTFFLYAASIYHILLGSKGCEIEMLKELPQFWSIESNIKLHTDNLNKFTRLDKLQNQS